MDSNDNSYKQGLDAIVLMRLGELDWTCEGLGVFCSKLVVKGRSPNYQATFKVTAHPNGDIRYSLYGTNNFFTLLEGSTGQHKYQEIKAQVEEKVAKEVIDSLNDPIRYTKYEDKNLYYTAPDMTGTSDEYSRWVQLYHEAATKQAYVTWTSGTGGSIAKK